MLRPKITIAAAAGLCGLLVLCVSSCRKPSPLDEAALSKRKAGPAPSAANVIKIEPPADPAPVETPVGAAAAESDGPVISTIQPAPWREWFMLLGILLVLFLLSLILFHTMGRRVRQKAFRAHAPTRHTDIWASHKPPQFLDP